ncbi:unnamed protein product, partial [Rotaria magnacalcarata]
DARVRIDDRLKNNGLDDDRHDDDGVHRMDSNDLDCHHGGDGDDGDDDLRVVTDSNNVDHLYNEMNMDNDGYHDGDSQDKYIDSS